MNTNVGPKKAWFKQISLYIDKQKIYGCLSNLTLTTLNSSPVHVLNPIKNRRQPRS